LQAIPPGTLRSTLLLLALGIAACLLALAVWVSRSTEAATVRTLVFSASPGNAMVAAIGLSQPKTRPLPNERRAVTVPDATPRAQPRLETAHNSPEPAKIQRKITPSGNYLLWPSDALDSSGSYDVVIHFHGIPQALEPALSESRLRAVLLVLESGTFTTDYKNAFGLPGTLERLLGAIRLQLAEFVPGKQPHERRVAVSAWSAGSGAVMPMLRRAEEAEKLDAVVLSDALHASFLDLKKREIGDSQLEPLVKFALLAIEGRKFLALSHTAIQTPDYGSTTETANRLLELLQLSPIHVLDSPTSVEPVATARTERGSFSVLGFGGADKHAHAVQQWAIGRTLWARLAQRWNQ